MPPFQLFPGFSNDIYFAEVTIVGSHFEIMCAADESTYTHRYLLMTGFDDN